MMLRLLVTALGFAIVCGAAGTAGVAAQEPAAAPTPPPSSSVAEDGRVFEMRTYYAAPGKIEDLHARFRDHTIRLFEKHGITNIGYWIPKEQPDTIVFILAYPSREAATASWDAFRQDAAWQQALTASEANGKLVEKVESVFMHATDYSTIK